MGLMSRAVRSGPCAHPFLYPPLLPQATINQQKRKISRQRDILSSLKARYAETDKRYIEENMRLTDEYKRITEQFKDLQGKFRHFEQVDTRKYAEVREGESDKERGRREKGEGVRGPPSHFFSEVVALHSCSSPKSP